MTYKISVNRSHSRKLSDRRFAGNSRATEIAQLKTGNAQYRADLRNPFITTFVLSIELAVRFTGVFLFTLPGFLMYPVAQHSALFITA